MNGWYSGDGDLHGDARGGNETYSVAKRGRGKGYDPDEDITHDTPDYFFSYRCVRYAVELKRLRS